MADCKINFVWRYCQPLLRNFCAATLTNLGERDARRRIQSGLNAVENSAEQEGETETEVQEKRPQGEQQDANKNAARG